MILSYGIKVRKKEIASKYPQDRLPFETKTLYDRHIARLCSEHQSQTEMYLQFASGSFDQLLLLSSVSNGRQEYYYSSNGL